MRIFKIRLSFYETRASNSKKPARFNSIKSRSKDIDELIIKYDQFENGDHFKSEEIQITYQTKFSPQQRGSTIEFRLSIKKIKEF